MKIRALSAAVTFAAMLLFACHAVAIPLYVTTGGIITGITGLESGGVSWDMQLHEGSYDDVIAVVGSSNALYTYEFAQAISLDLALFLNSTGSTPAPNTLLGCTATTDVCNIGTVFEEQNASTVLFRNVHVTDAGADGNWAGSASFFVNSISFTYATWTETAIPEPSIVLLLCTGLLGIFWVTRRNACT